MDPLGEDFFNIFFLNILPESLLKIKIAGNYVWDRFFYLFYTNMIVKVLVYFTNTVRDQSLRGFNLNFW